VTPLLSAHRGGPENLRPANSLAAIDAAARLGVDFVEFDVRVTADEQFVTCHDACVTDTAGRRVPIVELTMAEAMGSDPAITPLPAVLDAIAGRARGHVDVKDVTHAVPIADACAAVLGVSGFVLTTLDDAVVAEVRARRPEVDVALSLGRDTSALGPLAAARTRLAELFPAGRVARCTPTKLAVHHRLARAGVLRWAHRHGIPVLLWTLNSERLIRAAQRDRRVWAYTTDFPRLAMRLAGAGGDGASAAGGRRLDG
jgi:glycerophosphoryl diester phosphodiesterase